MADSPITNSIARVGESSALQDLVHQQVKTEQFTAAPMSVEGMTHHEMVFTGRVESAEQVQIEVIAGYTVHNYHHVVLTGKIDILNSYSPEPIEVTRLNVEKVTIREKGLGSQTTENSYSLAG